MHDLFEREAVILSHAKDFLASLSDDHPLYLQEYERLTQEYEHMLKQLRRVTKLSDKTTVDLNTDKLDLLGKVQHDALTGIYNRRYLEENLQKAIKTLSRSGGFLTVMMLDVDFFKKFNDTYGHSAGDDCLKTVANTLSNCIVREDDFVARYGGEEFILVLPNTEEVGARKIAERVLDSMRDCKIPHEKNEAASYITLSIGLTCAKVEFTQKNEDYIRRADEALYLSKKNGRNRFTFLKFEEASQ